MKIHRIKSKTICFKKNQIKNTKKLKKVYKMIHLKKK